MPGKTKQEVSTPDEPVRDLSVSARQNSVGGILSLSDLREKLGQEVSWAEIEPTFTVVNQEVFEGKPMVIGGFRFNQSKKFTKENPSGEGLIPAEFVSMLVAAYDPANEELVSVGVDQITGELLYWVIVNDGGAGINMQLERYAAKFDTDINVGARRVPPIKAEHGLRRSEYPYDDGKTVSTATTWYIG